MRGTTFQRKRLTLYRHFYRVLFKAQPFFLKRSLSFRIFRSLNDRSAACRTRTSFVLGSPWKCHDRNNQLIRVGDSVTEAQSATAAAVAATRTNFHLLRPPSRDSVVQSGSDVPSRRYETIDVLLRCLAANRPSVVVRFRWFLARFACSLARGVSRVCEAETVRVQAETDRNR